MTILENVEIDTAGVVIEDALTSIPESEIDVGYVFGGEANPVESVEPEVVVDGAAADAPPVADGEPSFASRLVRLSIELDDKRFEVSERAKALAVAREAAKSAKKSLDVSVEELQGIEVQMRALASAPPAKATVPADANEATTATAPAEDGAAFPTSPAAEPVAAVDISALGLSAGREEKLRLAGITTIPELELAISEGRLQQVKGFGPTAVDAVTDSLMAWRDKNPVVNA